MKNTKTKIIALLFAIFSFAYVTPASSVEGLSAGIGYVHGGFMGSGKETLGTAGGEVTEEDGAFEGSSVAVFLEYAAADNASIGLEVMMEDITTPENTNLQGATTNTVKATFENHATLYGKVNLPFGFYGKAGLIYVDILTQESLGTGGAYDDADTTGLTVGLGYEHSMDNGVFVRAEVMAAEYDDVSATNKNDSSKSVTVSDMYGATASLKIGRSF